MNKSLDMEMDMEILYSIEKSIQILMTSKVLPLHFAPSQASSSQNSNVDNF